MALPSSSIRASGKVVVSWSWSILDALVVSIQSVTFSTTEALVEFIQLSAVAICLSWVRVRARSSCLFEVAPVRSSCLSLIWDTSLVDLDVEVSIKTPSGSPWVLADPVVSMVVFGPSNNHNCMTSCFGVRVLWVNSVFVTEEVLVNCESSLDWTVGHDFLLDSRSSREFVEITDLDSVGVLAVVTALRWAHTIEDWVVLSGSLERIWQARIVNNSSVLEELPRVVQRTSIATTVVGVAQNHVFWGKNCSREISVLDASSVSECWGCRECPAWSAVQLWAHSSDAVALRAPVETFR